MIEEIIKYDKYISNSETELDGNIDIIKKEFNVKQKILMVSPTGSGKTKTILKVFDKTDSKNTINILATSNRQPCEQLKDLIKINIGGIDFRKYIKDDKLLYNNFCFVYDKISDVETFLLKYQDKYKINLVLDEAHLIFSQYNFRAKCINEILRIIEMINGVCIFLTGTPYTLKELFDFNKTIYFIDDNYKSNVENIKIIINESNIDDRTFFVSELLKINKGFIRLNSTKSNKEETKKIIDDIIKYLKMNGKTSDSICSKNKKNSTYKKIVENEELNSSYDYIFTTSILDQAVSITNFDETTIPVFIIQNKEDLNLDNIQQYLNRFRKTIKEFKILIPKGCNLNFLELKNLKDIFDYRINEKEEKINDLNIIKNNEYSPKKLTNTLFELYSNTNEYKDIEFINGIFFYDINLVKYFAINEYYSQYFFNINKLKEELKKRLKNNVQLEFIYECIINKIEPNKNKEYYKEIYTSLIEKPFLKGDLEDIKISLDRYKTIYKRETGNKTVDNLFSLEIISKSIELGYKLKIPVEKMIIKFKETNTQEEFKNYIESILFTTLNKEILNYKDIEDKLKDDNEKTYVGDFILGKEYKYFIREFYDFNTHKMKIASLNDDVINKVKNDLGISKAKVFVYVKMIFKTHQKTDRKNLSLLNLKLKI